jgi:hypothetical protein
MIVSRPSVCAAACASVGIFVSAAAGGLHQQRVVDRDPEPASSYVVQADHQIAGFAVRDDGTLAGALDEFGPPTRYQRDRTGWNGCVLTWRHLGLRIFFYNLAGKNSCRPAFGYFRDALITRTPWRTASGLRIGHPARLILRYHPRAKRDPQARNWWWLVTRRAAYRDDAYAGLSAKVHRGRVVALAVYYQAGGD